MARLAIGFIGILTLLAGAGAWATYLLGRLLGAPSWQSYASWATDRWRATADLSGDRLFTVTDVALWAGWLAYLPGDALVSRFLGSGIGVFLKLQQSSFGGTLSAMLSLLGWFGIGSAMIVAGSEE